MEIDRGDMVKSALHPAGKLEPSQKFGGASSYDPAGASDRLLAWLHNLCCLVARLEYHIENFHGFVHLGCLELPPGYL